MTPTKAMILAAQRAEFDYYQKGRPPGAGRFFVGTPEPVIKVMIEAVLDLVEVADPSAQTNHPLRRIVTARKPKRKPEPGR